MSTFYHNSPERATLCCFQTDIAGFYADQHKKPSFTSGLDRKFFYDDLNMLAQIADYRSLSGIGVCMKVHISAIHR